MCSARQRSSADQICRSRVNAPLRPVCDRSAALPPVLPPRGGPPVQSRLGITRGALSMDIVMEIRGHLAPHSLHTARATSSATGRSAPNRAANVLQIERRPMEAFPISAVDGDAVTDPNLVGDRPHMGRVSRGARHGRAP